MPPTVTPSLPTRLILIHTYRSLFRAGLYAVQFSTPARYAIRDKLRRAFRSRPITHYNQTRIDNTIAFLRAAGQRTGMEHQIVRNLCMVHFWQNNPKYRRHAVAARRGQNPATYSTYEETVKLLNESAELDLV